MLPQFTYHLAAGNRHFSNAWLILPNGSEDSRTAVPASRFAGSCFINESSGASRLSDQPLKTSRSADNLPDTPRLIQCDMVDDDILAIDWLFTDYAGHFFRVRHRPIQLTEAQIWRVRHIESDLRRQWNTAERLSQYGEIARIDLCWISAETLSVSPAPVATAPETYLSVFSNFSSVDCAAYTWSEEEQACLLRLQHLLPVIIKTGRILDFDPNRRRLRLTTPGENHRITFYSLTASDTERIEDCIKAALRRQEKRKGTSNPLSTLAASVI